MHYRWWWSWATGATRGTCPWTIVDVLGRAGEHDVEMHAILAEFRASHDFPEDVVRAA